MTVRACCHCVYTLLTEEQDKECAGWWSVFSASFVESIASLFFRPKLGLYEGPLRTRREQEVVM